MVRIPTAQELGVAPSIRAGAGVASIDNAGAIGNAAANVGQAVSQAAQIYQRDQEQLESFNAQAKWLETQSALDQAYQEAEANAPVDGKDFTRSTMESVGKGLEKALSEVPARLRPQYEVAAARARGAYQERAFRTEINQRERYYQDQVSRFGTNLLTDVQRDPDGYEKYLGGFGAYVDSTGLPPAKQAAMKEQAKALFLKARIDGLIDKGRDADAEGLRKELEEVGGVARAPNGNPDFENPSAPRGIRTNNPGNIKDGAWAKSQPGYVGGDGVNAKFATPEAGTAAMNKLLDSYAREGRNSVSSILSKWAPTSENDTSAYVQWVSNKLGVDPNAPLSPEQRGKLVDAMAHYENGRPFPGTNTARIGNESVGDYITARIATRDAKLRAQDNQMRVEQNRQTAAKLNDLEIGIIDGKAGLDDIYKARQEGWLTDADQILKVTNLVQQRDKDIVTTRRAVENIDGPNGKGSDYVFDPMDKDDKKQVELYSQAYKLGESIQNKDSRATQQAVTVLDRTGIIPKDVQGPLTAQFRSQDPATFTFGMSAMSALYQKNPDVFARSFGEQTARSVSVWSEVGKYLTPEQSFALIKKSADPANAADRDRLLKDIDKKIKDDPRSVAVEFIPKRIYQGQKYDGAEGNALGPYDRDMWRGSPPMMPAQASKLQYDYTKLYRENYVLANGDADAAKVATAQQMQRLWGETRVHGGGGESAYGIFGQRDRLMNYPPERYYPAVNGSYDWIKAAVNEAVKTRASAVADWELVPIPETAADVKAGGYPRYGVLVKDDAGKWAELRGADNLPAMIQFDPKAPTRAAEQKAQGRAMTGIRMAADAADTATELGATGAGNPFAMLPQEVAAPAVSPAMAQRARGQ